jgi:hypothetical protein
MPDIRKTHAVRLEEIRLELMRQNETLAKIAPHLSRSAPARSSAQHAAAAQFMRRA